MKGVKENECDERKENLLLCIMKKREYTTETRRFEGRTLFM